MYRVTELNVTRVWIKWAGRLAIGCMARNSLSELRFIPSPGTHIVFHGIVTFRPSSSLSPVEIAVPPRVIDFSFKYRREEHYTRRPSVRDSVRPNQRE